MRMRRKYDITKISRKCHNLIERKWKSGKGAKTERIKIPESSIYKTPE
jgi:hypothetical protein